MPMAGQTGLTRSLLMWGVQGKSLHIDGQATLHRTKVVQHTKTLAEKWMYIIHGNFV